jgi:hypothetical protein
VDCSGDILLIAIFFRGWLKLAGLPAQNIQTDTQTGTNGIQQPCLGNSIGVEHQCNAHPFSGLDGWLLSITISGITNDAKEYGTDEIGRARHCETHRFESLEIIHESLAYDFFRFVI